ncbi:hypothetical protein BJF78_08980 [Pseudonocardia sp. CNS-139]|nr:hypothetical protein BJF78_08980 [Pseudonocardia sp. CNS-139]
MRYAMNAAMPTPSRPEIAGWTGCLRKMRQPAMTTPAAIAATSAGCSPASTLTTMKTTTGTVEATIPCTPPICSMSVGNWRSRSGWRRRRRPRARAADQRSHRSYGVLAWQIS